MYVLTPYDEHTVANRAGRHLVLIDIENIAANPAPTVGTGSAVWLTLGTLCGLVGGTTMRQRRSEALS